MSVCGLSARSSRRVPPLMAPSPSPFFPPLLSSLFVLSHTSSNVSGRINFSPSSLCSLSSSHPSCLSSPSPPLLSLPLYPQLISSSCLICCPFQFNFFQPWLLPNAHMRACTHVHFSSHPFLPPLCLFLLSVSVSLSGVGSTLPSPPERVLSSLHVKLTSWGHVDLSCPFSGITSHLFTNVSDAKSVSCSSLQPQGCHASPVS